MGLSGQQQAAHEITERITVVSSGYTGQAPPFVLAFDLVANDVQDISQAKFLKNFRHSRSSEMAMYSFS